MPNQVDIAMTPGRTKVKKLQIEQGTGASPGCYASDKNGLLQCIAKL